MPGADASALHMGTWNVRTAKVFEILKDQFGDERSDEVVCVCVYVYVCVCVLMYVYVCLCIIVYS